MQKEINQSWHFNKSPQEVWEYLTNPDLIELWLMKSDFKPVVGHKFQFRHTPKTESKYAGITDCEVLEVKPFTRLSYSWKGSTNDGSRTFDSKIVWTLIPKENGTELHLQHNGFALLEDVLAHNQGWNNCLKRFETQINTVKQ
ncbi:MAG: SRPBCC domain-containing protein [Bacteroidota bacterium]